LGDGGIHLQSLAKGVMTMKRRVQINNKNMYDRLISYNKDLATTDIACVVELLTRETQTILKHIELAEGADIYTELRCRDVQKETDFKNCANCIQQFLNEEV
jgi:hypothetical protein